MIETSARTYRLCDPEGRLIELDHHDESRG